MDTNTKRESDRIVQVGGTVQFGDTTLTNAEQVRALINRLLIVEQVMENKTVGDVNCNEGGGGTFGAEDFDNMPLIDLDTVNFDSEENWLLDTGGKNSKSVELISMNSHLLSIRHDLLNIVKQALEQSRSVQVPSRVKRNTSYVVRREPEPQERSVPFYPSPKRHDVTASYTYRVPKSRVSPGRMSIFAPQDIDHDMDNDDMPSPVLASPSLNKTITIEKSPPLIDKYATVTRSPKLGTTFITSPTTDTDMNNHEPKSQGYHEMNVTFVKSSEDEAISSPSGSAHSPRNNSMEELQSRARQQEQRLRETPIRRKETQVIQYHEIKEAQAKLTSRTSSAETYSMGESNPDSGASSGVSSPRESRSYDNVELVPPAIRRSMPNLAHLNNAQRGRVPGLQIASNGGQIRPPSRYPSDPRLSVAPSSSRNMAGSSGYGAYGQRSSNLNKNQMPVYTRSDTFDKSRPQVLTLPDQSRQMTQSQGNRSMGNVGRTDPRYGGRPGLQKQMTYSQTDVYESRAGNNGAANGHKLSYARSSILPTSVPNNQAGNFEDKPRSRIPAPGSRTRHF